MYQRPWFDTGSFGKLHPSPAAYKGRLLEDPYLGQDVPVVINETADVMREGGALIDEATLTARETLPLAGRPRMTMITTAAIAGGVGAAVGRPIAGALIGAALGWFAHRTWAR
ncbi:MAG TPA: hypothetical protein VIY27_02090 [Myxococcota bacterium]